MAGISINLSGNFSKLNELESKCSKTAGKIKESFGFNIGKGMLGTVGIATSLAAAGTAAAAGVASAVKLAIDAGGELTDVMNRTGASGKGLVILQQMFKNAGMEASKVPAVINKLQKAMTGLNEEGEPTNAAFDKLGLSVSDLIGLDPVDAFAKIQSAMSSINDPATRAGIAMELFGKSGGEMLAVFQDSTAFSIAKQQVGSLADVLPAISEDIGAVEDAFKTLDLKSTQFGAGVADQLMPALLSLSKWINETDFVSAGEGIGSIIMKMKEVGGMAVKLTPAYWIAQAGNKAAGLIDGNPLDKGDEEAARKTILDSEESKKISPQDQLEKSNAKFRNLKRVEYETGISKNEEKARAEAEKKSIAEQEAAKKKRESQEKTRALTLEEYRLEKAMAEARENGDQTRLGYLEREKSIREEMAKLTAAGWNDEVARDAASKLVDGISAADNAEQRRKNDRPSINAGSLGAFAQSMNSISGRSPNAGLLDENKRQTSLLQKIADQTKPKPTAPMPTITAVFA